VRELVFRPEALEQLAWWVQNNRQSALRILRLIEEIQRNPFVGTGKPEPLKHQLSGAWSRRIDKAHRLVCQVSDQEITILSCRFHYE
jgi:toxin YoeB